MTVAFGTLIFLWLLVGCVLCYLDVSAECSHQEQLDELWEDE